MLLYYKKCIKNNTKSIGPTAMPIYPMFIHTYLHSPFRLCFIQLFPLFLLLLSFHFTIIIIQYQNIFNNSACVIQVLRPPTNILCLHVYVTYFIPCNINDRQICTCITYLPRLRYMSRAFLIINVIKAHSHCVLHIQ